MDPLAGLFFPSPTRVRSAVAQAEPASEMFMPTSEIEAAESLCVARSRPLGEWGEP